MLTFVPSNHVFTLPTPCPICGDKVSAMVNTFHQKPDGTWTASEIETQCESEPPPPDSDDNDDPDWLEWDNWYANHYAMPYVDWLPYEMKAMLPKSC